MPLAVGVGLVVFAMRFFELHCVKSAESQGVVVEIALCVCSYVLAWCVKWSVRSKQVDMNSMDSANYVNFANFVISALGVTVS